jgi:hypothetical protein
VKGVHSLGSAGSGEKRNMEVWNCCENRTCVWTAMCEEWTTSGLDLLVDS